MTSIDRQSATGSLSLTHWEFAPVDLGLFLTQPKAAQRVREVLRSFGWTDAEDEFSREDLNCVIPHRIGIFRLRSTLLYIPSSGYAVVRFEPSTTRITPTYEAQEHAVRNVLSRRVEIQREIEERGMLRSSPEVTETIEALRTKLRVLSRSSYRCATGQALHEYAFSVFAPGGAAAEWDRKLISALYSPRDVGYSISNDANTLPDAARFHHLVSTLSLCGPGHAVECTPGVEQLYAGWSTAVIEQKEHGTRDRTVTVCEFRVQSTWLAAYNTAQFASSVSTSDASSRRGRLLRHIGAEFTQVVSRQGQRLGPNSPEVPSRVVEILIDTSELASEMESADQALEAAYARKQMADDRHNARGRRLLELFALIFASSGLAQLFFPLPLDIETITTQAPLFAVWMLLNCVGAYLVLRQRY